MKVFKKRPINMVNLLFEKGGVVCPCAGVCVQLNVCLCMCSTYVCIFAYVQACIFIHAHIYMHMHIYTYLYMHMHIYTCTYIHVHLYMHIFPLSGVGKGWGKKKGMWEEKSGWGGSGKWIAAIRISTFMVTKGLFDRSIYLFGGKPY